MSDDPVDAQLVVSERLEIRPVQLDDAPFIFELMTDPDFITFIGDRNLDSAQTTRAYLSKRTLAESVDGRGLFVVRLRQNANPLGIVSLLLRDHLPAPDIGYAFLPAHRRQGYALEATRAMVGYAHDQLKMDRVVAVCSSDNSRSIRLLEKLGMQFDSMIRWSDDSPQESRMYTMSLTGNLNSECQASP